MLIKADKDVGKKYMVEEVEGKVDKALTMLGPSNKLIIILEKPSK